MDDFEIARRLQEEEDALDKAYFARKEQESQDDAVAATKSFTVSDTAIVGFFVNTIPHFGGLAELPNRFSLSFAQLFVGPKPPLHVVMFNYMVDPVWLIQAVPNFGSVGKVTIILDSRMRNMLGAFPGRNPFSHHPNCKVYFPQMSTRFSCHHTKLFLIYFETGVRVVITTANLLDYDWYNKNQGIWVQDFPIRSSEETKSASEIKGTFGQDLVTYLESTLKSLEGVSNREEVVDLARLRRHDFRAALSRLIYSTPCSASPALSEATGVGIHRIVQLTDLVHKHIANRDRGLKKLSDVPSKNESDSSALQIPPESSLKGLNTQNTLHMFLSAKSASKDIVREANESESLLDKSVIVQCSSLGSPGSNFFDILMSAFAPSANANNMKLIWPTLNDVRSSIEGYESGDAMPLSQINCSKFLEKHAFWRWNGEVSSRGSAMPHIKSYSRTYRVQNLGTEAFAAKLAWACLTSANATQAAWGRTSKLSGSAVILHFELGVWFDEALWFEKLEQVLLGHIPQELFWFSCTAPLEAPQIARALKDASRFEHKSPGALSGVIAELGEKRRREDNSKNSKQDLDTNKSCAGKEPLGVKDTSDLICEALRSVHIDLIQPKTTSAFEQVYCGPIFKTSAKEIIHDHPFIAIIESIRSWIKSVNSSVSDSLKTTLRPPSWNLRVILPLPFSLQPEPYTKDDVPWVVDVPRSETDIYGKQYSIST